MANAKEKRAFIKENALDAYAPDVFKQAEERFSAAEKAFGVDNEASKKALEAALPLYEKTIADGFAAKVAEKRTAAQAARAKADAEKARVAAKEPYAAADAAFARAESDSGAKKYSEAVAGYTEAAKRFDEAAAAAADRRVRARKALDDAGATIRTTEERLKAIDEELKAEEGGDK